MTSGVVRTGLVLVALQLALRAWSLSGSWFYFDDLAFMSAGMNDPLDWSFVSRAYAGHLMPGGWLVIKVLATWAPYDWAVWAGLLLLLQAAASIGMLRLLHSMFGDHPAVPALLACYLFYVFTVPAGIWFAAGINQLPFQVALVFGLHAHLEYLRHRRALSLVGAVAWSVFGLCFYEKSAIIFGLYGLVALCWFAQGKLGQRITFLWRRYWPGVVAYGLVAVPYLAVYLVYARNFGTGPPSGSLLAEVTYRLVGQAFSTAAVGGPFEWRSATASSLAAPSDLITLGSWIALGSLIWYAAATRTISKRAWSLVAFTLGANVYLLSAARADLVGPDIGLEYRYQTESAVVLVLSVALALLPLRGAAEVNELRPEGQRAFEVPGAIRLVTTLVVLASVASTLAYVRNWQDANLTRPYYDNARNSLARARSRPVPLVNLPIPQNLLWAFGYPENTYSHILRNLRSSTRYPRTSIDHLYVLDDTGKVTPAVIRAMRTMVGGRGCGYVLAHSPTTIPLDAPVVGEWWIGMAYGAPHSFGVTIGTGRSTRHLDLPAGTHIAYFRADGRYDSVVLDYDSRGRHACITQLILGEPTAAPST
ncbi:MAG TPA: hypothetical protein VFM09_05000 [Marmoricola sp.]|nr:hypothetical protein [Marmoricola sp.]